MRGLPGEAPTAGATAQARAVRVDHETVKTTDQWSAPARSGFVGASANLDRLLVRAMVGMAHALGLSVVAEGVETAEQLTALRGLDVDFAQGWLLGRPAPADRITPAPGRIAALPA